MYVSEIYVPKLPPFPLGMPSVRPYLAGMQARPKDATRHVDLRISVEDHERNLGARAREFALRQQRDHLPDPPGAAQRASAAGTQATVSHDEMADQTAATARPLTAVADDDLDAAIQEAMGEVVQTGILHWKAASGWGLC